MVTNAQTRVMFDATAKEYDPRVWFDRSARSPYAHATTEHRLRSAVALSGTETVLEVGCGPGTWTSVFAVHASSVHALDISPEMINRAKAFVDAPSVTFEVANFAEFRSDDTFDRVVSVRAIEYMSEGATAASKLASLVAPGGRVVIVTKTPRSVWRGRRLFGRVRRRLAPDSQPRGEHTTPVPEFYHRRLRPDALRRALDAAGLVDISVHPAVTGVPILRGVEGDVPVVPRRFTQSWLRAANRWANRIDGWPQFMVRRSLWLTESYIITGRRP